MISSTNIAARSTDSKILSHSNLQRFFRHLRATNSIDRAQILAKFEHLDYWMCPETINN